MSLHLLRSHTRGTCPRQPRTAIQPAGHRARPFTAAPQPRCRNSPAATHATPGSSDAGSSLVLAEPSLTRFMFERMEKQQQQRRAAAGGEAGGAGGRSSYQALLAADEAWSRLKLMKTGAAAGPAPDFVRRRPQQSVRNTSSSSTASSSGPCTYDVVVAGGTLGVFVAAALAARGWSVAVLERGPLVGRTQEWNISRRELEELVTEGLLTADEAESVVALEFNPVRIGFHGGADVWTRDVLNLGVKPDRLVSLMRSKLEAAGGKVYEGVTVAGVEVCGDGALLSLTSQAEQASGVRYTTSISCRLLLDCMGHASPIVQQLRWGIAPDGVCLVVGGCARGFDPAANTTADVIYTNTHMVRPGAAAAAAAASSSKQGVSSSSQQQQQQQQQSPAAAGTTKESQLVQYFWEAFPAADGLLAPLPKRKAGSSGSSSGSSEWRSDARTTYMFTYLDAQAWRPSLLQLYEDYWHLMPAYQGLPDGDVTRLDFQRLLFGVFPTYKDSPLRPGFDRVLQIGDASGIQSPLSFGGFGALTRHLGRLTAALHDALTVDALSQGDLQLLNAYNPGLSSAWMLQRAMTGSRTADGPSAPPDLINRMLAANFGAMAGMGDPVMKPFLQDVIQFGPLLRTMAAQMVSDPGFVPQLVGHVGPAALADWMLHVGALGAFTALQATAAPPLGLLAGHKGSLLPDDKAGYRVRRLLEAVRFGSGADYSL